MIQLRIRVFLLCTCSFWGCVSIQVVSPEQLQIDTSYDIVVLTHDGRTILMNAGDYQVVDVLDSKAIQGKGRLFLNNQRTESKSFAGVLPFNEIQTVEERHYSIFHYMGPIIVGAVALYYIAFLVLSLSGH